MPVIGDGSRLLGSERSDGGGHRAGRGRGGRVGAGLRAGGAAPVARCEGDGADGQDRRRGRPDQGHRRRLRGADSRSSGSAGGPPGGRRSPGGRRRRRGQRGQGGRRRVRWRPRPAWRGPRRPWPGDPRDAGPGARRPRRRRPAAPPAGLPDGGRVALQSGDGDRPVGGAGEGHLAGQALVQHEAERVEVGPTVEREPEHLLRRQVLGRAHHHVLGREVLVASLDRLGDAEVRQLDPALRRHQHVARLDVAVDEAGLVGVRQRGGHRPSDDERLVDAQATRLVEQRPQRPPRHELHDDGGPPGLLDRVVDADDVRVVEAGGGDGLPAEPLDHDRVVGQRRLQQLDRDLTIEDRVGRHPHLAHAAVSQSPVEAVPLGEKHRMGDPGRTRSGGGHRTSTLVEATSADRAYPVAMAARRSLYFALGRWAAPAAHVGPLGARSRQAVRAW